MLRPNWKKSRSVGGVLDAKAHGARVPEVKQAQGESAHTQTSACPRNTTADFPA